MMSCPLDLESWVRAAGDAMIAAGTDGKIIFWNPAATRIFGFTAEEALGCSLDLIIPERFRPRHWEGYRNVMATGQTRYASDILRVPALHKDGRLLSIAFTVALLYSSDGKPHAIAAIVRDETSRWKEERDLRNRLAELEQKGKRITE
jgi:PAS domain S-box-containing protein